MSIDQSKGLVTDASNSVTREKLIEMQRDQAVDTHVELQEKINASIDIVASKDKMLEDFVSKLAAADKKSTDLEQELGDYGKITDEMEENSQTILEPYVVELEQYGLSRERIAEMAADIAKSMKKKYPKKKK